MIITTTGEATTASAFDFENIIVSNMKVLAAVIGALALAFVVYASPFNSKIDLKKLEKLSPKGVLLGTIEGKIYFAEYTPTRNWTDAVDFCNATGMRLATIKTLGQATFLASNGNWPVNNSLYWTAARDAQTIQQFVWHYDQTALQDSPVNLTVLDAPIATCLAYYRYSAPRYHTKSCNLTYGTLCESS